MYTYKKIYIQYKKNYAYYLPKTIRLLNLIHKTSYDRSFWEPLIGLYLRRFLLNYLFINKIKKKKNIFPEFKNSNFFIDYRDYSNFFNSEKIDKINYYDFKKIKSKNFLPKKILNLNAKIKIKQQITYLIFRLLKIFKISKFSISFDFFSKSQKLNFFLKTKFKFFILKEPEKYIKKFNKLEIYKNRINIISAVNKVKNDIIFKNLIYYMPINYLELFKSNYHIVQKIPLYKSFYTEGNDVNFDLIKLYISRMKKHKMKIIFGQHAARTGYEDFDIYFEHCAQISDKYLTWGSKNKNNVSTKAGSLRLYSSLSNIKSAILQKKEFKNKICFVLCSFSNLGECLSDNYFENTKAEFSRRNLLKKLSGIHNNIYIKPRDRSFINKNNKIYKNIKIIKKKETMKEVVENYDILIYERLSVGILESIRLNKPVIFYFPKNIYQFKSLEYRKIITLLKKSKIFINDEKQLINIIKTKKNLTKWWTNEDNVKQRNILINNYAKLLNYNEFINFL